jgi:glycosyltransferase involved in cell wall biosynthesis
MLKVLYITNLIPHYRKSIYDDLGKELDLTIAHTGDLADSQYYKEIKLTPKKWGVIDYFAGEPDFNEYDVVVIWMHVMLWNLWRRLLFKSNNKNKIVIFGIGVSASYDKPYDRDWKMGSLMKQLVKRADACIFYDQYPAIKYAASGINPQKLFVVNNTVSSKAETITTRSQRDSFLFVGTLYHQKGIGILLDAYKKLSENRKDLPKLTIVGDGPDFVNIQNFIHTEKLNVELLGSITDEDRIGALFSKAICCVSPFQAGLSVQNAFSYGVPFVTKHYPISGGEFTSIVDEVTGYFFDGSSNNLAQVMNKILDNSEIDEVYQNCREFYIRFRSPKVWVKNFKSAIEYAHSLKN